MGLAREAGLSREVALRCHGSHSSPRNVVRQTSLARLVVSLAALSVLRGPVGHEAAPALLHDDQPFALQELQDA